MSVWAIIPVKPMKLAKSRLSGVLSPEQRAQLAEATFRHVVKVAEDSPHITGTLVISRDTRALAIARDLGAKTIQESSSSDLNPALTRATEITRMWGAEAVLVLPADLPFINADDIHRVIGLSVYSPCIVLATDSANDGTNVMFVRPPGLIEYQYGPGSFQRHAQAARAIGATVRFYDSETVTLDIDVPADLDRYNELIEHENIDPEILPPFTKR